MLFAGTNVAVATCHASRCVTVNGGNLFYEAIIEEFFQNGTGTLGEAVCNAKRTVISQNPGNDWLYGPAVLQTILGDPALRISTPVVVRDIATREPGIQRVRVEPNPFYGQAELLLTGKWGNATTATIFDEAGRVVEAFPVEQNRPCRFGKKLAPGIYFLVVRGDRDDGDQTTQNKKIIKIH